MHVFFGHVSRCLLGSLVGGVLLLVACATPAAATHFRYSHMSWQPLNSHAFGEEVKFTRRSAFRRDGYSGSASDGHLAVGDTFSETISNTRIDFGDGSNTSTLTYTVTSIEPAQNYVVGEVHVQHTYACSSGPCTFTAFLTADFGSCCRIQHCASPNAHLNADITSGGNNLSLIHI